MTLTLTGTVQRVEIGVGTWAIAATDGLQYELYRPTPDLQVEGLRVEATGTIREDVMTMAAIGPVFQVTRFSPLPATGT